MKTTLGDAGPTLKLHWANGSRLLGDDFGFLGDCVLLEMSFVYLLALSVFPLGGSPHLMVVVIVAVPAPTIHIQQTRDIDPILF